MSDEETKVGENTRLAPLERPVRRLPDSFVAEGLELAKGSCIFAVPFGELSREELLAVAAKGWEAESRAREEGAKRLAFMGELNKALRRA